MDERLLTAKVKCLNEPLFYNRYFFKHQYGKKFAINWHHEVIARALDLVYAGYLKRLIINMPPRYSKTELAVKGFIGNGLALNPSGKYIHLSYSDDLAKSNSDAVKTLIESREYQQLFPEVQLRADSKAKDSWSTSELGGVLARATGGQVTGFGAGAVDSEDDFAEWLEATERGEITEMPQDVLDDYIYRGIKSPLLDLSYARKSKFAGALVIDDPIKPDDADSEAKRLEVNEKFQSTARNRVNSRNTPIIIIMQRLHPEDLCGYLEREDEEDNWYRIVLPAINAQGEALWPLKHTIAELKKMETANERNFQRQYMQNPTPKAGLMFPIQDLNFFDPLDPEHAEALADPDYTFIAVDPANKGGDDFAAGPSKLRGSRIYIEQVLYNTDGTDFNEPRTAAMCMEERAATISVEGVLGWIQTANRIRDLLNESDFQGEFRILRPRTAKEVRIANRQSFIRNNFWFRKDYQNYPQYAKFMRVLTSYLKVQDAGKKSKKDDAPDYCEMVADHYENEFPGLWGG